MKFVVVWAFLAAHARQKAAGPTVLDREIGATACERDPTSSAANLLGTNGLCALVYSDEHAIELKPKVVSRTIAGRQHLHRQVKNTDPTTK